MDANDIRKEFETEYCKDCDPYKRCDDCTSDTPYSKHLESLVLSQAERIEELNKIINERDGALNIFAEDEVELDKTIADLNKQIEVLRMQLAGCGAVAMSNTKESAERNRISKDNPYYSASMSDVEKAVDREIKYRNEIEELKAERVWISVNESLPEPNSDCVLVCNSNGLTFDEREPIIAFLENDRKWYQPWIDKEVKSVTHWRKILNQFQSKVDQPKNEEASK